MNQDLCLYQILILLAKSFIPLGKFVKDDKFCLTNQNTILVHKVSSEHLLSYMLVIMNRKRSRHRGHRNRIKIEKKKCSWNKTRNGLKIKKNVVNIAKKKNQEINFINQVEKVLNGPFTILHKVIHTI